MADADIDLLRARIATTSPVVPVRSLPAVALGAVGDAASIAPPLARLTVEQARLVAGLTSGGLVVITPWRGLVLPGAAGRLKTLQRAGFVVDDDSPWSQLSACVGAPFCGKARIDTTEVAEALVAEGRPLPRTHLSGCERRCGAPAVDHVDLVAPTVAEAAAAARP